MKYLKLNIQLLFAFVIVLGLFSCTDEDAVDNGKKEIKEGLPTTVSLKLTSATPMVVETKTADEGGKFGVINDLAILVYKTETGELDKVTCVSNVNAKEWDGTFNATTGERRVYVLANSGLGENEIKNAYNQESNLLNAELISAGTTVPKGNEQMLGFVRKSSGDFGNFLIGNESSEPVDIPEGGDSTAPVVTLYSHLYPPYSKITFTVTNEVTDVKKQVLLDIKNVYVRNLPKYYSLLPKKEQIDLVNVDKQKQSLNKDESGKYNFYMYENLQGEHHKENEDSRFKNPFDDKSYDDFNAIDWDSKWAGATPCTYIEIEGSFKIWQGDDHSGYTLGSGPIHYRFFLGADTKKDFNVNRNTTYNITLAFKGLAGYDEIKYEWRVDAELEHATFVPEGLLEIDGSKGYYFPFYVVNNTANQVSFTTEGETTADMEILYDIDHHYATAVPSEEQLNIRPHVYKEYGVGPYNLGIIGHTGHVSGSGGVNNINVYRYYGTNPIFMNGKNIQYGSTVEDPNQNILLRDQVVACQIYRERVYTLSDQNKKLVVREYPLLCLSSDYGTQEDGTVYAQRIDHVDHSAEESKVDYNTAKKICFHGSSFGEQWEYSSPVEGSLNLKLPSKEQFRKLIELETGPLRPDVNLPYWCNDGKLYNWKGEEVVGNKGYVRCVYSYNGSDKI